MPGKATVDKVAVRVYPDATGFAEEMKRWTNRRWTTNVDVMLDTAEARAMMAALENEKGNVWVQARLDAKEAQAKLAELEKQRTYIDIEARFDDAQTQVKELRRQMQDLKTSVGELDDRAKYLRQSLKGAFGELDQETARKYKAELADISKLMRVFSDGETKLKLDTKEAKAELKKITEDRQIKAEVELEAKMAGARLALLTRARVVNLIAHIDSNTFTTEMKTLVAGMSGLTM
ncbi:MAG: hypothetical protein LBI33_12940, partial [Propionibacteriaceae bacterium]|nr:hypothetical protein [Propionibacteriaceae bacterium]